MEAMSLFHRKRT